MNSTLILATRNAKKGREMTALISPPWEPSPRLSGMEVKTLLEYPDIPETVEDAATFAGNARKKASEAAIALKSWVVADDSGLAVDALNGAPGIFSARYAGRHGDDQGNNRKLLEDLAAIPDELRGAAFVCALAVSDPKGNIVAEAEGKCRGRIIHEARGPAGFGYDPLFLILEYHKTFGELGSLVKHQLSHRARAFTRLRPMLERILQSLFDPGFWTTRQVILDEVQTGTNAELSKQFRVYPVRSAIGKKQLPDGMETFFENRPTARSPDPEKIPIELH